MIGALYLGQYWITVGGSIPSGAPAPIYLRAPSPARGHATTAAIRGSITTPPARGHATTAAIRGSITTPPARGSITTVDA